MNLIREWGSIRFHFNKCFRSNFYVSIASIDANNIPTVTPIGTLFLNDDRTGFYFEKFPSKLPVHAENNVNICVLGVNSNRFYWIMALFREKFTTPPAIKLYGILGTKRKATPKEKVRLDRRMQATKILKGNIYLWRSMNFVREVHFTKAEKINLGKMTF